MNPTTSTENKTSVPKELSELQQFVVWTYGKLRKNGKREKVPINPHTGKRAKADEPATWGTFEEATRHANEEGLDGIGFVFTAEDEFAGVDLDNCRDPKTSIIDPWALKVIRRFSSYTEVSPSGTGVKIFVRGKLPEGRNRRGSVEMYDRVRFFTITGAVLDGYGVIEGRQEALEGLHARMCAGDRQKATATQREVVPVQADDQELLDRARTAGKGNGQKFKRLYDEGNLSGYDSHSEADMALMLLLAFWTGRDKSRMESLFSASALGRRDKWIRRQDYRQRTIDLAASRCERTYTPKPCAEGEVQRMTEAMKVSAVTDSWTGRTGPRERWLYQALLDTVCVYGKACADGVVVAASSRELALKCGTKRSTVENLLGKLEERGRIKRIEKGSGNKASKYILTPQLPREGHKELPRGVHKEKILIYNPTVFIYGPLLARVRDAAPQTDKTHDKNGRKINQESRDLLRSIGSLNSLIIEKVLAWPGMDISGLTQSLGRPPSKVDREGYLPLLIEGGFIVEEGGCYFAPDDLADRLLDLLNEAGCLKREDDLRRRYKDDRDGYEKRRREKRLTAIARECGAEPEHETDGRRDAILDRYETDRVRMEESEATSSAEPDGHVKDLERIEDLAVITNPNDPEQFKALAATIREGIARHRENLPPRKEPFKWPHDPDKFTFFFPD